MSFLADAGVLKRLARREVRQTIEPLAGTGQLARADLEGRLLGRNAGEWDRLVLAL